jgi:hypothetical protein
MRSQTLWLALATCVLAGCNQPAVTPKPPAFQSSENTVRDWNDVAHRISGGMASLGLVPSIGQPEPATPARPVYIRVQAPDSAFVQQVANELESDILQRGGVIARTPSDATVVNLDVNFVRWGPRDKAPGPAALITSLYALPAAVIVPSLPMSTWVAADAAAFSWFGLAAVTDLAIALTPTMNAEAVWAATIVTNDRTVMKLQEPIYIRAPDIALYAKATTLSPVASWGRTAPLRPRTIRYDP